MIAVGVERPFDGTPEAVVETNLYHAFLGVCNIVFSFCKSRHYILLTKLTRCRWTRRILQFHFRAEGPKRVPQISLPPPGHGHDSVYCQCRRHLLLRRAWCYFACAGLSKPYHWKDRLRNCPPNGMHPVTIRIMQLINSIDHHWRRRQRPRR